MVIINFTSRSAPLQNTCCKSSLYRQKRSALDPKQEGHVFDGEVPRPQAPALFGLTAITIVHCRKLQRIASSASMRMPC